MTQIARMQSSRRGFAAGPSHRQIRAGRRVWQWEHETAALRMNDIVEIRPNRNLRNLRMNSSA